MNTRTREAIKEFADRVLMLAEVIEVSTGVKVNTLEAVVTELRYALDNDETITEVR